MEISQDTMRIFRRFEYLENQRAVFDEHWRELLTYMNPNATKPRQQDYQGTQRSVGEIFSSVVLNAIDTAVAAISGILVPSTSKWFDIELAQKQLNLLEGVPQWLEEAANIAFDELSNSNLSASMGQIIRDLLIIGTANVFVTEKKGYDDQYEGLNFLVYEAGSYAIAENHEKEVDTVFQKLKMSIRAAAMQWGEENLSNKMQERLLEFPDEMIDILHIQMPREDVNYKEVDETTPATKLPFKSCYYECATKHKIHEGGFHERAYCVPRWTVFTGETYGRSPGMAALPDVKTLNMQRKYHLRQLAKMVDPPLAVLDRQVIGKLNTNPGGLNYIRQPQAVVPLTVVGDLQNLAFDESNLEASIRQIFFNHLLQFPNQNPGGGTTPVSATEFSLRNEQMLRNAIPSIACIQTDLLKLLVERTFSILLRAGRFPDPPPALLEQSGNVRFTIRYSNPISKAMKAQEADSLLRYMTQVTQFAQVYPQLLEVLNPDAIGVWLADKFSIPTSLLLSQEQIDAKNEQKEAQQQALATQQGIAGLSENLKNISPFIKTLNDTQQLQQGVPQ